MPGKLAYRWERCNPNGRSCAAIPRATRSSYTVSGADLGHALLAVVQASNGTTIQNAFSTATPAVVPSTVKGPAPIIGPTVGGYAVVGQPLAAHPGIWQGSAPPRSFTSGTAATRTEPTVPSPKARRRAPIR